ncbi:MAG: hypothetical protein KGJ21_09780 [Pseudomonadota bacterium]|nr:hypothetical protein [Pseudomonadota bacterium]
MKISDPQRPWMFTSSWFLQRAYDTWAVLTGEWSLHKAWQRGKDLGAQDEFHRIIRNGGDLIPVLNAAIQATWKEALDGEIGEAKLNEIRAKAWERYKKDNSLYAVLSKITREAVRKASL